MLPGNLTIYLTEAMAAPFNWKYVLIGIWILNAAASGTYMAFNLLSYANMKPVFGSMGKQVNTCICIVTWYSRWNNHLAQLLKLLPKLTT